jgi:hypothetical protein
MMSPALEEKPGFENIEAADSDQGVAATNNDSKAASAAKAAADDFGFSLAEQRRITRQVDRRLVLTVGAMYCVSLMDRTNLGAANIAGMAKDLELIGNRYVRRSFICSPTPIAFLQTSASSSLP